jgi:hypothetical protein
MPHFNDQGHEEAAKLAKRYGQTSDNESISGLREIIADLNRENELLRRGLKEIHQRCLMPADSNFVWLRDTVSTIMRATLNGKEITWTGIAPDLTTKGRKEI